MIESYFQGKDDQEPGRGPQSSKYEAEESPGRISYPTKFSQGEFE